MTQNNGVLKGLVIGLLAGSAIGAVLALLYAPKSGKELRGRCPIHRGEGGDTFHANTEKNAFHCFSCGAKGNALDLVAALEHSSVRDAASKLRAIPATAVFALPRGVTRSAIP